MHIMFAFMVLLFPIVLSFCCAHSEKKIYGFLIAVGAVTGVFVSGCTAVFSYMHRVPEYSFLSNFFYYFLKEYALPMLVIYAVYFFVTKDSVEFRVKAFFPIISAFYAIYMPYCTIASSTSAFSFYLLFVKPVIFLSMVFFCSAICYAIYSSVLEHRKLKLAMNIVAVIVVLVVPCVLETLWLMTQVLPVVYILAVTYGLVALILFFFESRKGRRFLF